MNPNIEEYVAKEEVRLNDQKLKKLASLKREKGGPADPKLTFATFALMAGTALFFDAISFIMNFIPLIGGLLQSFTLTPVAAMTFFFWMKMKGVSLTKGSNGLASILVLIIGFIPIINALPEWTIYVVRLYITDSKQFRNAQNVLKKP